MSIQNNKANPDEQSQEPNENLINKNKKALADSERNWDSGNDQDPSNVDHNKPQFERSDLNANREQRAGSGGGGLDPDRNSGDR